MIIFHPEHVQPILSGLKIKTRRMGKRRWNVNRVHKAKTAMVSRDYFALLRILTLHQEPLGAMTEKDALEEGGYTLSGYREAWERIYLRPWSPDLIVWVVQFERVFDLNEICRKCWQFNLPVPCNSGKCCVKLLFDIPEKYAACREIVQFCCKERCSHNREYHDTTCPIRRAGVTEEHPSAVKAQDEKDGHGFVIRRLSDYSLPG